MALAAAHCCLVLDWDRVLYSGTGSSFGARSRRPREIHDQALVAVMDASCSLAGPVTAAPAPPAEPLPLLGLLPTHLLEAVLMRLDCRSLAACCAACRALRSAAGSEALWAAQIHREFGMQLPSPLAPPSAPRPPAPGTSQQPQLPQLPQPAWAPVAPEPTGGDDAPLAATDNDDPKPTTPVTAEPSLRPVSPAASSLSRAAAAAAAVERHESAQSAFGRLALSPLARHLLYVSCFERVVGSVTSWRSAWLRFRLPGWVRTAAEEQPAWEPGDTCSGSGGAYGQEGEPYMELTVFAESRVPNSCGGSGEGRLRWPAMHSSPFRLPQGDRMRLLQSHVEGLYVWDDEDDGDGEEDDEEEGDDEDDGEADEDPEREGDGVHKGRGQGPAPPSPGLSPPPPPPPARPPRPPRPPLHLAAYLHYEQLLPVCPPQLMQQGCLALALQPPPPAHPGTSNFAARISGGGQQRPDPGTSLPDSGPSTSTSTSVSHTRPDVKHHPSGTVAAPAISTAAATTTTTSSPVAPAAATTAVSAPPPPPPPAVAASTAATAASSAAPPAPSPSPSLLLYLDWSLLPTATSPEGEAAGVAGGGGGGGWVAGCVVRLWLDAAAASPTLQRPGPGGTVPAVPPGLVSPPHHRSVQCAVGDSRRGDVVLLSPPPPPPPIRATGGAANNSLASAAAAAAAAAPSSAPGAGGGAVTWESAPEQEGRGGRGGAAAQLAAAWQRAFGPRRVGALDPDGFAAGADLGVRGLGNGGCRGGGQATERAAAATTTAGGPSGDGGEVGGGGDGGAASPSGPVHAGGSSAAGVGAVVAEAAEAQRNAEAAIRLRALCDGSAPLMVDLALLDPTGGGRGRVRLGRCGVEMWSGGQEEEGDGGVQGGPPSGSVSVHFLLDQLPPRLQSLWDNRLSIHANAPGTSV
ncbi:hypothetical protein PLESTM_000735500 [Pleodorina starrii]|nr:hypothetical protein PLESTM_000735500 [Pleodorina starrii]